MECWRVTIDELRFVMSIDYEILLAFRRDSFFQRRVHVFLVCDFRYGSQQQALHAPGVLRLSSNG
jgi:hypothetical protein